MIDHDADLGHRLSRRRRGRDGDGVRRCADRSRRRARHLVDRRHAAGGHWHDAYPFVQLHQASVFYGVASTVLGTGAVQHQGPEAGLQERARRSEIQAYYDDILYRRFVGTGRVTFLAASEYNSDGAANTVTS